MSDSEQPHVTEHSPPAPPREIPPHVRSEFLRTVIGRGYLHQATDLAGIDALASDGALVAYIGFDATADSLHVGSLVQIMLLRHLQRAGHRPIVLMGGGTTRVGDPSGKDAQRQLLDDARIERNIAGIQRIFERFLTFGPGPSDAILVNNADWLDTLLYIPFLRDIGRHFSVNRMLGFDSVRLRLEREQPLSFLEFNYMVLQAYDFLELSRRYRCRLQMGGSDQWGNIVSGIELARKVDGVELYGLTSPLVTTASGAKMGKTAAGAVWLSPERCSPWEYWQYWRNTEDADVGRFLRLFTELPEEEITRLERLRGAEINAAKIVLATEATALCHGREAAEAARETARRTFAEGAWGADLPRIRVSRGELEGGIALPELFRRSGLAGSTSEARRLIRGGGARVNDIPVRDEKATVGPDALTGGNLIKLSAGRKRHALIEVGETGAEETRPA